MKQSLYLLFLLLHFTKISTKSESYATLIAPPIYPIDFITSQGSSTFTQKVTTNNLRVRAHVFLHTNPLLSSEQPIIFAGQKIYCYGLQTTAPGTFFVTLNGQNEVILYHQQTEELSLSTDYNATYTTAIVSPKATPLLIGNDTTEIILGSQSNPSNITLKGNIFLFNADTTTIRAEDTQGALVFQTPYQTNEDITAASITCQKELSAETLSCEGTFLITTSLTCPGNISLGTVTTQEPLHSATFIFANNQWSTNGQIVTLNSLPLATGNIRESYLAIGLNLPSESIFFVKIQDNQTITALNESITLSSDAEILLGKPNTQTALIGSVINLSGSTIGVTSETASGSLTISQDTAIKNETSGSILLITNEEPLLINGNNTTIEELVSLDPQSSISIDPQDSEGNLFLDLETIHILTPQALPQGEQAKVLSANTNLQLGIHSISQSIRNTDKKSKKRKKQLEKIIQMYKSLEKTHEKYSKK
jgi:hypothetical protein